MDEAKEVAAAKQHDLEKKLRATQEQNRTLEEEVEEAQTELASTSRQNKYQLQEIESKHTKLQQTLNDLRTDLENKESVLQSTQQRLEGREAEVINLESEVLKLRSQSGDVEELATIKQQLSQQVEYIRNLETTGRQQKNELRRFQDDYKAKSIIEEEKRSLQNQVERLEEVERELGEAKIQRQLLEDERGAWVSYLENSMTDGRAEFDSPEAMARALTEERMEKAEIANTLGSLQPQLLEKNATITSLEAECSKLKAELETAKNNAVSSSTTAAPSSSSETRAKARLERQKNLAIKEVEYLREQLKVFESEDATSDASAVASINEATRARIATLEDLVTQYRSEVQTLQTELSSTSQPQPPPSSTTTTAHKRLSPSLTDSTPDPRLGELSRKNTTLQHTLSTLQKSHNTLSASLSAAQTQISSLQSASRTRILSLRSNPTDAHAAVKARTLAVLQAENKALHAQLTGQPATDTGKVVPLSYWESAQAEIQALKISMGEKEKRMDRLRSIWSQKTLEFRAAVRSLLGWRMDSLPGGKFRLTSLFYPDPEDEAVDEEADRRWGTSLVFDGETGTMKVAGGAESEFGREIRGLVRFWVEEKGEVPGLLAAATLEWLENKKGSGEGMG